MAREIEAVEPVAQAAQKRRFGRLKCRDDAGEPAERQAQGAQVAGVGGSGGGAADEALEVVHLAQIVAQTHRRGMHFISHTCGGILDIIEDFIEIGVDVVQIDQQDNMGIDELARRYAGRICFFCPVDIQTTLPVGTWPQIEAKAKHLMKAFGSRGGGFMAKTYPQPEAINIPEANTKFMCEVFKRYGRYPLTF